MDYDYVDHPDHYNRPGRKECIEEMYILFGKQAVIDFCKLSAYKYIYRAGSKPAADASADEEKANWYLKKAEELENGGRLLCL